MDLCPYCRVNIIVTTHLKDGGSKACPLCNNYFHGNQHKGLIGNCSFCIIKREKKDKQCPECGLSTNDCIWDEKNCYYTCKRCDTKYF